MDTDIQKEQSVQTEKNHADLSGVLFQSMNTFSEWVYQNNTTKNNATNFQNNTKMYQNNI